MTLPRILIIDDQLAKQADLRGELCDRCDLVEISISTSDAELERNAQGKLGGAVFCPGQLAYGDQSENSLDVVERAVKAGWPSSEGWHWALVLLDSRFDSLPPKPSDATFGLRLLERLVELWPDPVAEHGNCELPVIMLSGISYSERGRAADRAGARAYIEKKDLDRTRLRRFLEEDGLLQDSDPMGRSQDRLLLGRSLSLLKVFRRAREISRRLYVNAMVLGPQGSGKSTLAEYIHCYSRRRGPYKHYYVRPTVAQLEYSNLFGYWKGAHDHADQSVAGYAEEAHGGTLLIDEVHGLQSKSQQELFEFCRLEGDNKRWLTRLGNFPARPPKDAKEARESVLGELEPNSINPRICVDVLLLSATNQSLDDREWRSKNGFADPLYMRLAEEYAREPIYFPSLAERMEDLPILFGSFLESATHEIGGRWPKDISPEVFARLKEYDWPGNVAELKGVAIAAAASASDFDEVLLRHLPRLGGRKTPPSRTSEAKGQASDNDQSSNKMVALEVAEIQRALDNAHIGGSRTELQGAIKSLAGGYGRLLGRILEKALAETKDINGNIVPTAALKILLNDSKISSTQAASQLLRFAKLMPDRPSPDSDLGCALSWAKKLRRTPKKKHSNA